MVKRLYILLSILGFVLLFQACSIISSKEQLLSNKITKHPWIVNSYVDNSINQMLEIPNVIYDFNSDGTFSKTYENGDVYVANWSFAEDAEYIIMGNNTFRVNTLTTRLMGFSYGEIDMFFVPADE